jgi:hypothetical protein
MARLAVITKSFAPDYQLCAALNRSVLANSPGTTQHHIIVPRSDLKQFSRLAGLRTHIRSEAEFLPRTFVPVPFTNVTVNLARPFPPIRGWILQQLVKLAAVAASEEDAVLIADSDVEFFRPFTTEMFIRGDKVRFFCKPNLIGEELPRHMIWHRVARELLGLPPAEPPYSDYISSPLAWDPTIVRRLLGRIADTTGRPWYTAIAGQLHFSECVLYGVFVDSVIGAVASSFVSGDSLCRVYWEQTPLNAESAAHFVSSVRPTDIAAVIQSKSRTPLAVREATFAALRASDINRSQKPSESH